MKQIISFYSLFTFCLVLFATFGIFFTSYVFADSPVGASTPDTKTQVLSPKIDPAAYVEYFKIVNAYSALKSYRGVSILTTRIGPGLKTKTVYTIKFDYQSPDKLSLTEYNGTDILFTMVSDGTNMKVYSPVQAKHAMADVRNTPLEDILLNDIMFDGPSAPCMALAFVVASNDAWAYITDPRDGRLTLRHVPASKNPFGVALDVLDSRGAVGPSSRVVLQVGEKDHLIRASSVTDTPYVEAPIAEVDTVVQPNAKLDSSIFQVSPPARATKNDLATVLASIGAPTHPKTRPHIDPEAMKVLEETKAAYASLKSLTCTSVTNRGDGTDVIVYQAPDLFSVTGYDGKKIFGRSTYDGKLVGSYFSRDNTYWEAPPEGNANLWDMVYWSRAGSGQVMQYITHPNAFTEITPSLDLVSVTLSRSRAVVDGVPVDVVTIKTGGDEPTITTLKIGKSDHLIRDDLTVWPKNGGDSLDEKETDVHANRPIDPSVFTLNPPQGATKVNPPPLVHQLL
jgi:outer membrane lipoprotein-sorting protein